MWLRWKAGPAAVAVSHKSVLRCLPHELREPFTLTSHGSQGSPLRLVSRSDEKVQMREVVRLSNVKAETKKLRNIAGTRSIVGIDESGGYQLHEPVIAVALYMPDDLAIAGVDDSKVVDTKRLAPIILSCPDISIGVGASFPNERLYDSVLSRNVAMTRAVFCLRNLLVEQGKDANNLFLIIDGLAIANAWIRSQEHFCGYPAKQAAKADSTYHEVAAASVIATWLRRRA
eukprot:gene13122-20259_t